MLTVSLKLCCKASLLFGSKTYKIVNGKLFEYSQSFKYYFSVYIFFDSIFCVGVGCLVYVLVKCRVNVF